MLPCPHTACLTDPAGGYEYQTFEDECKGIVLCAYSGPSP